MRPGGTSPSVMGHGRPATSGLPAGRSTGLGRASSSWCSAMPTPAGSWTGGCRSIPVWSAPTSMPPAPARGAGPSGLGCPARVGPLPGRPVNQDPGGRRWARPAAGDPRHTRPDCGHYRAVGIGGRGQGGPSWWDWPAAGAAQLPGRRQGLQQPGQPGRAARRIAHTIPERDDQRAHRRRRGRQGGRPVGFCREQYRRRNQVERGFNRRKQLRAVATRYDKLKRRYEATLTIASILDWLRATPDASRS